jgi:hypothetical protein
MRMLKQLKSAIISATSNRPGKLLAAALPPRLARRAAGERRTAMERLLETAGLRVDLRRLAARWVTLL